MPQEKNLVPGSAQMLLLRLLSERDMYGYQMIEELAKRSNDTFALKAGTLYPILHALEAEGSIESYEQPGGAVTAGKPRRYYRITAAGRGMLEARQTEWRRVSRAINAVLDACRRFRLPTACPYAASQLYDAATGDKKRDGGSIDVVVLEEIGRARTVRLDLEGLRAFVEAAL